MKVNTISRSNYSIKTNNNSKPAFKGKNFARVLENFDFSPYGHFPHDQVPKGIKELLELASKEPGFKLLNKDLYDKLKEPKTSYEFWDLVEELYKLSWLNRGHIIARDSQGPLIKYSETEDGLLEFVSKDQSGNDQSVTLGVKPLYTGLFYTYKTNKVPNGVLFS